MRAWYFVFPVIILAIVLTLVILLYKSAPVDVTPPLPPSDPSAGGSCYFQGSDVYNKKVFDIHGTPITDGKTQVPCATCSQYVFRDTDGCITLGYDKSNLGGVCTAGMVNKTGNWGIPIPKTCPFEKSDASSTS